MMVASTIKTTPTLGAASPLLGMVTPIGKANITMPTMPMLSLATEPLGIASSTAAKANHYAATAIGVCPLLSSCTPSPTEAPPTRALIAIIFPTPKAGTGRLRPMPITVATRGASPAMTLTTVATTTTMCD